MISVITGDVINSRKVKKPRIWLAPLKKILKVQGNTPKTWEIFRGDSFQLQIRKPADALMMAIRIKACIRSIKNLDVRMAIGVGQRGYSAAKITESNGEAFIYSGEKLDELEKERQTLAIRTPWPGFDDEMNLCLRLALIAMDNWTPGSAELMELLIQRPAMLQQEIGNVLRISQSSVSERQKRAYHTEIMSLETLYRHKINSILKK